ncbi:MAG TPA: hypothetical protein VL133_14985, partial [Devosia sp.]|nr:hypothetical protein [Devosia sp.]
MSPAVGFAKSLRLMLLAGTAVIALTGCAMNSTISPDYSGQPRAQAQQSLAELGARYKAKPGDKSLAIYYA